MGFSEEWLAMTDEQKYPNGKRAEPSKSDKPLVEAMALRDGWWNLATPAAPGAAPGAESPRPTRQYMPMVSNLSAQDGRTVVGTSTPLARALRSGQRS